MRRRALQRRAAAALCAALLALTLVACGSGDGSDEGAANATLDLEDTVKGMLFTKPTALEPLDIETVDFTSTATGREYTDVVGCSVP